MSAFHRGGALLTLMLGLSVPLLSGCERPTPIKELASQPDKFKGQEVRIRGRVVSQYSLPMMKKSMYVVSDGTGQMNVLTTGDAPEANSELTVVGDLKDAPAVKVPVVGNVTFGSVMIEEKERVVQPSK